MTVSAEIAEAIEAWGASEVELVRDDGVSLGLLRTRAYLSVMKRELKAPRYSNEELAATSEEGACDFEELWAYLHRDRGEAWAGENIPAEGLEGASSDRSTGLSTPAEKEHAA
ncbi:MAG: hypothetical protein AAF907_00925 [Planctomycetota bacterium]